MGVPCVLYARFELLLSGPHSADYTNAIGRLTHLSIRKRF
jgi:hypothetical protein